MYCILSPCSLFPIMETRLLYPLGQSKIVPTRRCYSNEYNIMSLARSSTRIHHRKPPKNLRYPRRTKLPPDFGVNTFLKKKTSPVSDPTSSEDSIPESLVLDSSNGSEADDDDDYGDKEEYMNEVDVEEDGDDNNVDWSSDEIEAISSLFRGRIPQNPGKLNRERPLPLPLPYKIRPLGLPTPKKHAISSRKSVSKQEYNNPTFLIELAKEIKNLPPDKDASTVLDEYARFLRKGSLSLTIRELGHMDLPDRALQIFCWAQKQSLLFPDDRILASTVEVLARTRELRMPFNLENFISLASKNVYEAMLRGLIRGGNLKLAWKLLSDARVGNRVLDASIYAKLILELGKNPDKYVLVSVLLDELGEREELNLTQQDCTAVMKICIRLMKFEIVESLFNWFKQSGGEPSVVMYTTLIHSRYSEEKYREALAVVWEMEASSCLFDLPAYRVVIRLFVALNDIARAARYFSKLKEAGFHPTFGIYSDLIKLMWILGGWPSLERSTRRPNWQDSSWIKKQGQNYCNLGDKSGDFVTIPMMEPEVIEAEIVLPTHLSFKKVQMYEKFPKGQSRGRHWKHLKQIIQAENYQNYPPDEPNYVNIETPPSMHPCKKICDITGYEAPYHDPRTNLRYANTDVFKLIRSLPNEYVQSYLALRNAAVVLR